MDKVELSSNALSVLLLIVRSTTSLPLTAIPTSPVLNTDTSMTERFKRWLRWWPAIPLVLIVVWFWWPLPRLAAAEAQWNRFKPNTYRLVICTVGAWDIAGTTIDSTVQNGRIISQACGDGFNKPKPCAHAFLSTSMVPDIFKYIRDYTSDFCIRATYDVVFGNPTSIRQGCRGGSGDDWVSIDVTVEAISK
jgi:hypothetical protein